MLGVRAGMPRLARGCGLAGLVAVSLLLPAGAAGVCEGDCFWGLGGCVLASTLSLGRDLGLHLAGTLGLGSAWLSQVPGPGPAILRWALERLRHSGIVDGARAALIAAGAWGSEAMPTSGAARGAVAAALQAVDGWRGGFVEVFPEHAPAIPGRTALLGSALWVVLAALLVAWCAARLLGSLLCVRRRRCDVMFFPDRSGRHLARVCRELASARRRLWLAIFVLTDDTLAAEVLRAHARGIDVRIIADDEQYETALGSDVQRLADAGVPVLLDNSTARMHHKFVVLDDVVMSGSFDWTKQASVANNENLCVMRDAAAVQAFAGEFRRLWGDFSRRGRRPGRPSQEKRSRRPGRHHTPPAR